MEKLSQHFFHVGHPEIVFLYSEETPTYEEYCRTENSYSEKRNSVAAKMLSRDSFNKELTL